MANEVLVKQGGKLILGGSDCNPSAGNLRGTETDLFTIDNVANGIWHQSVKIDLGLGNALWGARFRIAAGIEWITTAPTAGNTVDFYIGYSDNSVVGDDNPGNLSGADAVYNGYGAAAVDAAEAAKQLIYVGSLVCTADIDTQVAEIGIISPLGRYACLVIDNESGQTINATDGIECAVHINELIDEVQ